MHSKHGASHLPAPAGLLHQAKQLGFADRQIAKSLGSNEIAVRRLRHEYGIFPFVKQIDTVAAEFPAFTNYLYTTYNAIENDVDFNDRGVMVIGSGVYRIGSSVEFDWCAVRCIRTLRERGFKTIMVNYNPETVSTDYDEADRLYFETITLETILDIYELERSAGVIVSVGGQTPNNIALPLLRQNVQIFGTSPAMIDTAENRYKFSRMLDRIGVDQPQWKELTDMKEAHEFCSKVDYPVLVRPSYVLSGAAMNVVYSSNDLDSYLTQAADVSQDHPVVITKYIEEAKEIEMDAIALNGNLIMHYISEHVENAGVHSGDATLVHPPQDLDPETIRRIEVATRKIADALNVTGPMNIQFMAKDNEIKVIECNLRAARSYPFVSKVTGVDAIQMATDAMLGLTVSPYPAVKLPANYVGVKVPQFSFSRLLGADPILGVEMASTGEVACFGKDRYDAYLKALLASGITLPTGNVMLSIGSFKEKMEMLPSIQKLHRLGYSLFATSGTADFIQEHGVPVKYLETLPETDVVDQRSEYSLKEHISQNKIDLYINLPSKNRFRRPASYLSNGYRSRRMAVDFAVPLITNVKCAKLFVEALARKPAFFQVAPVDSKTTRGFADLEQPDLDVSFRARSPPIGSPRLAPTQPTPLAQPASLDVAMQAPAPAFGQMQPTPYPGYGMPMGYPYQSYPGMQPYQMPGQMQQQQQPFGYMHPSPYGMMPPAMSAPQPPVAMPSFPLEPAFHRRHILSVKQFSRNDLHSLFSIAHEMRKLTERNSAIELLRGRVLCTLFYEPSTRTSASFEAAMLRLGGKVVAVPVDRSSVLKGESLEDTIRTVGCYSDAVVLRHPDVGSPQRAAKFSPVPILSAGDGTGEHPTQAMLDIYTIREELGTVNGLVVTSKPYFLLRHANKCSELRLTDLIHFCDFSGGRLEERTHCPQPGATAVAVQRDSQLRRPGFALHARQRQGLRHICRRALPRDHEPRRGGAQVGRAVRHARARRALRHQGRVREREGLVRGEQRSAHEGQGEHDCHAPLASQGRDRP